MGNCQIRFELVQLISVIDQPPVEVAFTYITLIKIIHIEYFSDPAITHKLFIV